MPVKRLHPFLAEANELVRAFATSWQTAKNPTTTSLTK
jgi:hypothetical protein